MTTEQIAQEVTALLRKGEFNKVYEDFFHAEKIRHIEPQNEHFPDLTGVKALRDKDAIIQENIASFDSLEVGDPVVAATHFALPYKFSATMKDGSSFSLDEIIVYAVEDGKIVLEQFFY